MHSGVLPVSLPAQLRLHGLNHQYFIRLSILSSSSSSTQPLSLRFPATTQLCLVPLPELPPVGWLVVPRTCLDLQLQHHPPLHRPTNAASTRVKEKSEGKKEGWGRERRIEKASPPKKERDHPSQRLRYSPVLQRKPIHTCSIWSQGAPCAARKATRTMQLGLVALAMIFLSSMGHSDALVFSKTRRQRRGEFSLSQLVFVSLFFLFRTAGFHFYGLSHSGGCLINILQAKLR